MTLAPTATRPTAIRAAPKAVALRGVRSRGNKNHKAAKPQPNRTPLLSRGGVAAPSRKWSHSFEGAAGVVGSTTDILWLNQPPRLRPLRRLRGIFVDGAATPPWLRRGVWLAQKSCQKNKKLRTCYTKTRRHKEGPPYKAQ